MQANQNLRQKINNGNGTEWGQFENTNMISDIIARPEVQLPL